jgi:beta-glucosidase
MNGRELVALICLPWLSATAQAPPSQPVLGARVAPIIERDGLRFRDLNRNGSLDRYEDWRLRSDDRARDLVARMSLEEKAGAMMHGTARSVGPMGGVGVGRQYDTLRNRELISGAHVNSMITRLGGEPGSLADEHNKLQEIAERSRLGIPLTISTDPRHHFQYVVGASVMAGQFSQWPEALGLAALRDTQLVRRFADVARQEYRAVGITMTLSPQADLATEPRWSRINGTFGEDADVVGPLVRAYVDGFQHGAGGTDTAGVLAVVKHWVGYGAAKDGFDSHSSYGRYATFPSGNLEYHVRPFLGAFAANVAGVMPTYSILEGATLDGVPIEPVGAGFNKQLLTQLLRGRYGFRGVIVTDWAVTNDCAERCQKGSPAGERPSFAHVAMPWGVEHLAKVDRFVKAVDAGVDQFGGTEEGSMLVDAVRAHKLTEARLDESVHRIMRQKLELGLFENPYVEPARAASVVGSPRFQQAAMAAQRRALVLLENRNSILPLRPSVKRVYFHRVDTALARRYGWTAVADPADADVAIARIDAPFETLHPNYVFGAMQHEGSLVFRDGNADLEAVERISAKVPTIVTVYLDRPAILTPIRDLANGLLANFGVSDAALLDVISGRAKPEGRLPFELPSSMAAVEGQRSDRPHDTIRPLYPIWFGRRY